MAENSLPDSVQPHLPGVAGRSSSMTMSSSTSKIPVYEADVVVENSNDWRKYFDRKFADDFADRDKVDKLYVSEVRPVASRARSGAGEGLGSIGSVVRSLGVEKAESLLNGKTVQDLVLLQK